MFDMGLCITNDADYVRGDNCVMEESGHSTDHVDDGGEMTEEAMVRNRLSTVTEATYLSRTLTS